MLKKALVALSIAASLSTPASASASNNDEKAAICAEANARYQEIFGSDKLPADTVIVTTYKYNFCPGSISVKPGTTVRWVNVEKRTSHSVWPKESGRPESVRFFPDESFEIKFEDEGIYPYLCGPHWEQEGMVGTVTVKK